MQLGFRILKIWDENYITLISTLSVPREFMKSRKILDFSKFLDVFRIDVFKFRFFPDFSFFEIMRFFWNISQFCRIFRDNFAFLSVLYNRYFPPWIWSKNCVGLLFVVTQRHIYSTRLNLFKFFEFFLTFLNFSLFRPNSIFTFPFPRFHQVFELWNSNKER